MRRVSTLVIALALLAAACGGNTSSTDDTTQDGSGSTTTLVLDDGRDPEGIVGDPDSGSTTSSTSTSTSTSTTTSTTLPPVAVASLNGLPLDDETLLDRRVVAVKIDNHAQARPQSGLMEADAVIELLVEGGFTRFISLWHTNDTERLGPVRSGRPTDPTLIRPTGAVFVISGAQNWVAGRIINAGVNILGEGPGTYRINTRVAPHNLYASTLDLRDAADARGFPDEFQGPLYEIGAWDTLPDAEATEISFSWDPTHTNSWVYEDGVYRRFEGSSIHEWIDSDGNQQQIEADVIVVLQGEKYTASGSSGSAVPATNTVGTGPAYVFYQGRVAEGTWSRNDITEPFLLTGADGAALTVPPGMPWINVFPTQRPLSWQ
ncbi:DUF3048 domain-containing protein [bacterium]|nr:DUF3048 domain-containing protein [bacterium]